MDNQHRKITGYRELSQAEIDMMNKVKAAGAQFEQLVAEVDKHLRQQQQDATNGVAKAGEGERLYAAQPMRWASIARTHFQEGLMALTRAVAQPTSF